MNNTEMLMRIRELHQELSVMNDHLDAEQPVDDQTIDALGQLVTDVSVLIDHARGTQVDAAGPVRDDVLDRIAEFESQHPRVSMFLSQVTDILAMMGI